MGFLLKQKIKKVYFKLSFGSLIKKSKIQISLVIRQNVAFFFEQLINYIATFLSFLLISLLNSCPFIK